MDLKSVLVLWLGLVQCLALKYESQKRYKYVYSTSVQFNSINNTKSRDVGFEIAAEIEVFTVFSSEAEALFQLQVKAARVKSVSRFDLKNDLSSITKNPVYFILSSNTVENVLISEKDSIFDVNFKKGIIALFQVETKAGSRKEVDVSGECDVRYTVSGDVVTKSKEKCVNFEIAGEFYNTKQVMGVAVNNQRSTLYEIKDGIIQSAVGSDGHSSRLNINPSLNTEVTARQHLKLVETVAGSAAGKASNLQEAIEALDTETGGPYTSTLLPSSSEVQHCTENCITPAKVVSKHGDNLVAEKLSTPESAQAFIEVLRSFRGVGKQTIAEVLTSKDSYYYVQQLMDAAVAAQTPAAQKSLLELVQMEDDYNTEYPERYLFALAFSSHPQAFIISDLVDLIKRKVPNTHVRESILLSSGAVVYTYSQAGDQINDLVVQDYQHAVLEGLDACPSDDELCRLMHLRSLGNAGLPSSLPTIMNYVKTTSTTVISTAMQALRRIPHQYFTPEDLLVILKIFHQTDRAYDSSLRIEAMSLLLKHRPSSQVVRNIILASTNQSTFEFSTHVLARIKDMANRNEELRKTIVDVLRDVRINNYNVMAQRGNSSAFSSFLGETKHTNCMYGLYVENTNTNIMKRSSMLVDLVGDSATEQLLSFDLYADGLQSLMGDEEEGGGEEVEPTAGMSLTLMGVLLRPIEFFRGSGELMSAAWNAPSDPLSVLQGNLLLQDHSQKFHLSNGFVVNLEVTGAISIHLSGSISLSLWNRNSHSVVKNSGALYIDGSMRLESNSFQAGVGFTVGGGSSIEFITDVDFYEFPIKICLKMTRPSFNVRQGVSKFEKAKDFKKGYKAKHKKTVFVPEASFVLNKASSRQCRLMVLDD